MTRPAFAALLLLAAPAAAAEELLPRFAAPEATRAVIRAEPGGLRLVTPPPALTRSLGLPHLWTADANHALTGDFEFAASFQVATLGGTPPAAEANVELALVGPPDYNPVGINVNTNPGDGR